MGTTEKSAGSFSKVKKLITFMRKCNGRAVVGSDGLIPAGAAKILMRSLLLVAAAALCAVAYFLQPYAAGSVTTRNLAPSLMLILLLLSFVLGIKDIVTVLYMADDLGLLLSMPFSAGQIVMAKLAVVSVFPVTLSVIVMNALCLGFGIREGAGVPFVIGTVLSGVMIPVTGISAATLLVVVLFRVFRFIRSRDMSIAAGGVFSFGIIVAYTFLRDRFVGEGADGMAVFVMLASASRVFPNISFMTRFMFDGSVSALLVSLAVPFALILLALTAVRSFYADTALSMQTTASGKKMTKAVLYGGKKKSALRALTDYEAKSAGRNPAYLIYGFVINFLWPVLFILPCILGNNLLSAGIPLPMDTIPALPAVMSFAVMASCFSFGFNTLPGNAFSREGSSFYAIRALPVDPADYCRSKRNFSMLLCSGGSTLYVAVAGIVCLAAGFISAGSSWVIPAGVCVSLLLNLVFSDLMLLKASKKPQLDWDSETEFARKLGVPNGVMIVAGVFMLVVFMAILALGLILSEPPFERITLTVCTAAGLLILIAALVLERFAVKKAVKNLMKLE